MSEQICPIPGCNIPARKCWIHDKTDLIKEIYRMRKIGEEMMVIIRRRK